ncbi:MAG: Mor transcription activator family protein [Pseudomonadota bacterium]
MELIGLVETVRLLRACGGSRRYIPKGHSYRAGVWDVISEHAFDKLCAEYAGETLELPKVDSFIRAERDLEIIQLSRQGVSRSQLVKRFGLTYRQIGNIRRRYREEEAKGARYENYHSSRLAKVAESAGCYSARNGGNK